MQEIQSPILETTVSQEYLPRVHSSNLTVCRICHQNDPFGENLISPCKCKGSMASVHRTCLEHWLSQSGRLSCELCGWEFDAERKLKYRFAESVSLWVNMPANKTRMQSDMVVAGILTIVTMGLLGVAIVGMEYFLLEGRRMGISVYVTRGGLLLFMGIIVAGYMVTIFVMISDQVRPWYTWWRKNITVRLKIKPEVLKCPMEVF